MSNVPPTRSFLFLQGPHGVLFARLAQALAECGHAVYRINLNGGDRIDWPGRATNYCGGLRSWPLFFDDFVVDHGVTDVILFGDCRPHHGRAHAMAKLRGIRVHVLEEGYLRPDFMTLQEDGVNGHSTLPQDPAWYREEAKRLPPVTMPDAVPSSFGRRMRETSRYTLGSISYVLMFPLYRSHRTANALVEALGWALRFALKRRQRVRAARTWETVRHLHYFALPLQLNSDYQMRVHSPFGDMRAALRFVIKSFARFAPDDCHLVIKRHPLDSGITGWGSHVRALARQYEVTGRVHYLGEGDIADLVTNARGVVTVNSTVGTLALNSGVPVAVLGEAVYNVKGVVHGGSLDTFWTAPTAPDPELYDAFRRVLVERCLIPGGYLSEEGIAMLVEGARARLIASVTPWSATSRVLDGC